MTVADVPAPMGRGLEEVGDAHAGAGVEPTPSGGVVRTALPRNRCWQGQLEAVASRPDQPRWRGSRGTNQRVKRIHLAA